MRTTSILILSAAATGCASGSPPPEAPSPTRAVVRIDAGQGGYHDLELTREDDVTTAWLDAAVDELWRHLPAVYEELGLEAGDLSIFNPVRHQIGVSNQRLSRLAGQRLSSFIACGHSLAGDNADRGHTLVSLSTWLEAESGGTTVRTRLQAVSRDGATSTSPVDCATRGTLEKEITVRLQRRVEGTGA